MSPEERLEPPRIIFGDGPIEVIKEAERAHDYYVRPKGDLTIGSAHSEVLLSLDDHNHVNVKNWERTIEKGELFLRSY